MKPDQQRKTEAKAFIRRIENLGAGELAKLRRACGDRLGECPDCFWIFGLFESVEPKEEETYFLIATLLAQYSTNQIKRKAHRGQESENFGETWRKAIGPMASTS